MTTMDGVRAVTRVALLLGLCGVVTACTSSYQSAFDEDPAPAAASTGGDAAEAPTLVAAGDAAWANRDDEAQVRAAIESWERAVALDPSDHATWTRIARGYYFLGDGHLRFTDEAALRGNYERGVQAGERALAALSPEFAERVRAGERIEEVVGILPATAVPALYWRATNLGRWAQQEGFATVLSYKDEVRATLTHCLEQDRYYFFAAPDRYFGAFYSIAPAYAGGDLDRSREHFEHSMARFPNYFGTRVLMAENYAVKAQNRELFVELLQYVLDGDPEALPDVAPENRVEQRKARQLMEQVDDLFE
jgi:tetratricopeptide (TPR) repeat protein